MTSVAIQIFSARVYSNPKPKANEQVAEAYDPMMNGNAQFRVVLTM